MMCIFKRSMLRVIDDPAPRNGWKMTLKKLRAIENLVNIECQLMDPAKCSAVLNLYAEVFELARLGLWAKENLTAIEYSLNEHECSTTKSAIESYGDYK